MPSGTELGNGLPSDRGRIFNACTQQFIVAGSVKKIAVPSQRSQTWETAGADQSLANQSLVQGSLRADILAGTTRTYNQPPSGKNAFRQKQLPPDFSNSEVSTVTVFKPSR